ncbi:hypothetical protein [uncultured Brachyspira sp.]|jgi:hypothetical protein|uniref:hypothetical protein n=1 Tax=uncultured Brachyspira sp. TaxID=221953 RepID=UPI00260F86F0|nr:hypothetical protein [uncultured Brachyspira sp.]
MDKTTITENLDSLTYAMSDEEIVKLNNELLEFIMEKYHTEDVTLEMVDFIDTVPYPRKLIDSLVKIGEGTREELEAENRRLYAERGWEKYLL